MKLQNKHWGSTAGIIVGLLSILSGMGGSGALPAYTISGGFIYLLGSLAYRQKKKYLLQVSTNPPNKILLFFIFLIVFFHIPKGHNGLEIIYEHPSDIFVPIIWVGLAYLALIKFEIDNKTTKKTNTQNKKLKKSIKNKIKIPRNGDFL